MLDAVATTPLSMIIVGIIWAITFGFAAGNYACSLVHRLPRGRLILDKKPYCGSCGALLQVKDLFPVISAVLLRHRCRYCGTPYPVSHTWTEILVGFLFVLTFLKYGFTEQFLLVVMTGIFLITLAAIEANEGIIMGKLILCVIVFGALFRVLQDHTIFGVVQGALFALIAGAIIWRGDIKKVGHIYVMPMPVQLFVMAGICVGAAQLPKFIILAAAVYVGDWLARKILGAKKPPLITVTAGVATTLLVLYPNFQ